MKWLISTLLIAISFTTKSQQKIPFEFVVIDSVQNSPAKPYGKAIGDINNDNQPDLLISSALGGGIHWYMYPNWEKRTIRNVGSWSEDCQLFDIDMDGDLDLINGNKNGLFWYENPSVNKKGYPYSFWDEHYVGSDGINIHDLEIADINSDSLPDIVIRYEKENQKPVHIFIQNSPERWQLISNTNTSFRKGEGLALADIDKDNDTDIVIGHIWLENKNRGKDWEEHRYADAMPEQVLIRVADMNMDGNNDIVVSPQSTQKGNLSWYSTGNNIKNLWEEHIILSNTSHKHGLAIGDFNLDGFPDIHTSTRHDYKGGAANVSIWLSNGQSTLLFWEQVLDENGSHYSKIGDIDNDGDLDIFGANWSSKEGSKVTIKLWRNQIK